MKHENMKTFEKNQKIFWGKMQTYNAHSEKIREIEKENLIRKYPEHKFDFNVEKYFTNEKPCNNKGLDK